MKKTWKIFPDNKPYTLTSNYGKRVLGGKEEFHDGVDFGTPVGTPQAFLSDGVIRRVRTDRYGGKYVQLKRNDGGGEFFVHCDRIHVKEGQKVKAGQLVAHSGNTGRSTAPHTHYGIQTNADVWSSRTNPMPHLRRAEVDLNVGDKYKLLQAQIRLRKTPNGHILLNMLKDATVAVLSNEGVINGKYFWVKVSYEGKTGYMAFEHSFVKLISSAMPEPKPVPVNPLEEENKLLKERIEKLEGDVKSLGETVKTLKVMNDDLKVKLESCESVNAIMRTEKAGLQDKLKQYESFSGVLSAFIGLIVLKLQEILKRSKGE